MKSLKSLLVFGLAGLLVSPAYAWKSYHLEDNLYAIVCDNGYIFSYQGSSDGLSTVGPALCEKHDHASSGSAGGGAGKVTLERASIGVRQAIEHCSARDGAKAVREHRNVMHCPGRMEGQDYNSSRSNRIKS
ncbi:hypothetical protein [Roseinatronobacter monicus]|uniref:Uncharacterized protein n=1 Tax=Roseinatronobacter monicus TaxID=393481 RepID=A0A543K3J4_9RHOB|nr:hypothetical protein [Roseinatronobacter monicus]TQM89639.1 hypothetical protein BD293_4669 [Roseinatronobacter monicus]